MNSKLEKHMLFKDKVIGARSLIVQTIKSCLLSLSIITLIGCAGGSRTSFQCPEAKGLMCMPVDRVYAMIENGEVKHIENQLLCKGKKRCNYEEFKPELKMSKIYEAQLNEEEDKNKEVRIDNTLYVK